MSHLIKTLVALSLVVGVSVLAPYCASAQTSSSETTVETRGVGFKGANVFAPKYKERIGTYEEQIQMGTTKGWLTEAEAASFKTRLEEMKTMEADAASKGWVKADVDKVEKVFTQFNIDLTKAANKPAGGAAKSTTTTAKPADAVAGGETKTTTKTTKTTVKKSKAPAKKTTTTTAKTTAK